MRQWKIEKEERVREVERGGICVWRLAAHFSWKRALIAISSNAHHGKDEVISPAPSLTSVKNSQGIHCVGLGLWLGLRLVWSVLGWVGFLVGLREFRICQSVNYSI